MCSATEVSTGTFTSITSRGSTSGSTYTQDPASGSGAYDVVTYSVATPSPTPSPTPTASPVASPTATPTVSPTPSSSPEMVTAYVGEYSIPAFSGTNNTAYGGPAGTYTAAATTGCLIVGIEQPVGGTAGQSRVRNVAVAQDNSVVIGDPNQDDTVDYVETVNTIGAITSFTITNLTKTTGTASFVLDNGKSGTGTITGSITEVVDASGRVRNPELKYYMRYKSHEWYRLHGGGPIR